MYIETVPINGCTDGKRRTGNERRGVSQPNGVIHVLISHQWLAIGNDNQIKKCSRVSPSWSAVALGSCSVRHRNQALLRALLSFSPAG